MANTKVGMVAIYIEPGVQRINFEGHEHKISLYADWDAVNY